MTFMTKTSVATVFSLRLLGAVGAVVMSAAIMCSVFGTLNGNLLVGPRLLYAMGEDKLVPEVLGRVHPHYRTPALAILVLAVWSCLLVVVATVVQGLGLIKDDVVDVLTNF